MGGQPSARGQPLVLGKLFIGGKPTWLQHQQAWDKTAPTSPSIPTTTGLYLGHPYLGVVNSFWTQPNPTDIPLQGTMPYQSVYPTIQTKQYLPPPYIGGPIGQTQYIVVPYVQSQYMGGQPGQPPYMGGPYSFVISLQPRHGLTVVPAQHGYHQYPKTNQKNLILGYVRSSGSIAFNK
jgi:hypothetical protein